MRKSKVLLAILAIFASSKAAASTEFNGLYDAQSMGMAGAGVAFLDSAGAIPVNPAALDQIKKMALTLDIFYMWNQHLAPFTITHVDAAGNAYQNYESLRADPTGGPMGFLGGAYRLFDRIVIGAAVYPTIGSGTSRSYTPAPDTKPDLSLKYKMAMLMLEFGVPVSVRLLNNLSVALMWRATYMNQSATKPMPGSGVGGTVYSVATGDPVYVDLSVSGWNFTGLEVGLFYKPLPFLRFGFAYRSKVTIDGSGTTKTTNPLDNNPIHMETTMSFASPHYFRAGVAVSLLNDKLLLALDGKYIMYSDSNKSATVTTAQENQPPKSTISYSYWKDVYDFNLGGEYQLFERFKLRLGYALMTMATPKEYAIQYMAPPGISHYFGAGIGYKVFERLNVDIGGIYIYGKTKVDVATPDNGGVGYYGTSAGNVSLSATYRM